MISPIRRVMPGSQELGDLGRIMLTITIQGDDCRITLLSTCRNPVSNAVPLPWLGVWRMTSAPAAVAQVGGIIGGTIIHYQNGQVFPGRLTTAEIFLLSL